MTGGRFRQGPDDVGQSIAHFTSYEKAQKAVSTLIAADVPARQIAIVGKGVRSVERVTGRLGYAAAARSGAVNGVLLGLLFSAILVIGTPSVPIQAFVGVLFVGIAIGMLMSLITYSIVRRRRDFASVTQFIAVFYEVTVTAGNSARAREVLGDAASPDVPDDEEPEAEETLFPERDAEPPRYGERVAPAAIEPNPESSPEPVDESDPHIVENPATPER